jgi:hypothetical protein
MQTANGFPRTSSVLRHSRKLLIGLRRILRFSRPDDVFFKKHYDERQGKYYGKRVLWFWEFLGYHDKEESSVERTFG